jgi:hypothetical protein
MTPSSPLFRRSDLLLAVVVGCVAAWVLLPHAVLNPLDVSWIPGSGDHAVHYLGWEFFAREPWLQWPLTKVWSYGRGLTDSIVFTDSIPLLALLLKPLRCWTQRPINYFGPWMVLSLVLQYLLAVAWLRCRGVEQAAARCLGLLVMLAPPLLFRTTGHTALTSHWLLLAPLLLFELPTLWWPWAGLLVLAELVHPYLLVMVMGLAIAYAWERRVQLRQALRRPGFLLGLGLFGLLLVATAVAIGYGPLKPAYATASGYGTFRWNLLAPFTAFPSLSQIWPRWPLQTAELEGLSFPGIVLLVMGLVLVLVGRSVWRWRHPALTMACAAMALFAMTPVIGIGPWQLDLGRLPWPLFILGDVFRASGRFVWPLYYVVVLNILLAFATWLRPWSKRWRLGLIGLLVLVALLDLRHYRMASVAPAAPLRMNPAALAQVLERHGVNAITFVPTTEQVPAWEEFAWAALDVGASTNGTYLARYNRGVMEQQNQQSIAAIAERRPLVHVVYVLATPQMRALALENYPVCSAAHGSGHCLTTLAGEQVLIPTVPSGVTPHG